MALILTSTLTCPHCGHRSLEAMPTDACVHFYQCAACGVTLTPKPGDCCVFCSYGDAPCPPVQEARSEISCCGSAVRARFRQDEEGGG